MRPPKRLVLLHLLLAIGSAGAFFVVWGDVPVWDDAGFVLRYLDNFAAGHFYAFNPSDGPVFGLSSFLHGLVSGAFAASGLFDPETAMFASNFLGLVLLSFVTLRLVARQQGPWWVTLIAWLVVLGAAPRLVINLKQGLETPLHAGVLVATLLAFSARRTRTTLLLAALCVAAKLDLAPAALVLALLAVWRAERSAEGSANWRRAVVVFVAWFAVPVLVVLGTTALIFGSPMPQSAMAKLEYHQHPTGGWVAFLGGLRTMRSAIQLGVVLALVQLALALRARRSFDLALYAPSIALVATLAGFVYYDPGEQMGWYYAVPDLLIVLQVVLLAHAIPRQSQMRGAPVWTLAAVLVLAYVQYPRTEGHVTHTRWYERTCEAERIDIGEWIGTQAAATDTIMTWFGHVGRYSGLYILDETGLNSPVATDLGLDSGRLLSTRRPQWVERVGLLHPDLERLGYRLVGSWYNFPALIRYPTNRVYRRDDGDSLYLTAPVIADSIATDGEIEGGAGAGFVLARGTRWSFPLPATEGTPQVLLCGIQRGAHAIELRARAASEDSVFTWTIDVPALPSGPPVMEQTLEWRMELPQTPMIGSLEIEARAVEGQVTLIDPVVVTRVAR